jgi:hypothetical protein
VILVRQAAEDLKQLSQLFSSAEKFLRAAEGLGYSGYSHSWQGREYEAWYFEIGNNILTLLSDGSFLVPTENGCKRLTRSTTYDEFCSWELDLDPSFDIISFVHPLAQRIRYLRRTKNRQMTKRLLIASVVIAVLLLANDWATAFVVVILLIGFFVVERNE